MGYEAEFEITTFIPWSLRLGKIAYCLGMKRGIILMRDSVIEEVWKPLGLGLFLKSTNQISLVGSRFESDGTLVTEADIKDLDDLVVETLALQERAIISQRSLDLDTDKLSQGEIDAMITKRNAESAVITTQEMMKLPIDSDEDWFP